MKKHTKLKLPLRKELRITHISNLTNDFSMSIEVCIYTYNMDHVHMK